MRALCLMLMLSGMARAEVAASTWEPARTWVFAVSIARFRGDALHDFDPAQRIDGDFEKLLLERGVPRDQLVMLKDEQATAPRIREQFEQQLKRTRPGDFLFFYFGSHGGHDARRASWFFCTYENADLSYDWAVDAVEKHFRGSRALMTTDCCYSGGIVDVVKRRPGARVSYACLSSMAADVSGSNVWRFMRWLMRGFGGDPRVDRDGDGYVQLDELAHATTAELSFLRDTHPAYLTTGQFSGGFRVAADVGPRVPGVGLPVFVETKGQLAKGAVEAVDGDRRQVRHGGDDQLEWVPALRVWPALSGRWTGNYTNSVGEEGASTMQVTEAPDGAISAEWDGVALAGQRTGSEGAYLEGKTAARRYAITLRVEPGKLSGSYAARRPDGSRYFGTIRVERP